MNSLTETSEPTQPVDVTCPKCGGEGGGEAMTQVDVDHWIPTGEFIACDVCDGHGRVTQDVATEYDRVQHMRRFHRSCGCDDCERYLERVEQSRRARQLDPTLPW